MAIYSGTTAECLVDFGQRFVQPAGNAMFASFTKMSEESSIAFWTRGEYLPTGEALLKARCFLALCGYHVAELEALPSVTRSLATIISTELVTVDKVAEVIGYADRGGVFKVVLRHGGLMPDRFFKLNRLVETYGEDLQAATEMWQEQIVKLELTEPAASADVVQPVQPKSVKPKQDQSVLTAKTAVPVVTETQSSSLRRRVRDRPAVTTVSSPVEVTSTPTPLDVQPTTVEAPKAPDHGVANLNAVRAFMHLVQSMGDLQTIVSSADEIAELRKRISPREAKKLGRFLTELHK